MKTSEELEHIENELNLLEESRALDVPRSSI